MSFFKKHTLCQYKQLIEIAVVDTIGKKYRFSIHYLFLSIRFQNRLRVLVETDEVTPITSLENIYINANWLEREV
jgi:NADH:ubiquinone oxidoreductase subunit C